MHWHRAIGHYAALGEPYVIATVLATSGSTPRASSSKMVITADQQDDTIGGGQFEWLVIEQARAQLAAGRSGAGIHHFPLAAAATQCCGGSVTVLLEAFAAPPCAVAVFGAGHVGERVIGLLAELPVHLRWFDARPERVSAPGDGRPPCEALSDPATAVGSLRADSEVLILTHDHQLDYALTLASVQAGFAQIGLIGSATKAERFRRRLADAGVDAGAIDRVRCPVGAPAVSGKEPMAIAVAIVAELLARRPLPETDAAPLTWRALKASLLQGRQS
ncbi:MAG: xanthine dehydrogenase accessory protein XdhC [Pseudomonadota bacterium]